MLLVLRVVGWPEGSDHLPIEAHFDEDGGMIGRSETARLCLPDPKRTVSRFHAHISSRDDVFSIEDMGSTNPASLNGTLLGANQRVALNIGDQVKVGDYTLAVEFGDPLRAQSAMSKSRYEGWGDEDVAHTRFLDPEAGSDESSEERHAHLRASTLPLSPSIMGREISQALPLAGALPSSSPPTRPAPVRDAPPTIPTRQEKSVTGTPAPREAPPNISLATRDGVTPGAPRGAGVQVPVDVLWRAFQEGLRIHLDTPNSLRPELMRGLGQMLRSAVVGLRRLWAVNGQSKSAAEESIQGGRANNPLKLASDDARALAALLRQPMAGLLTGSAAVDELIHALEAKQTTSPAAVRSAVDQVLLRLAPQAIEQQLKGAGMIGGALPMWRKAKLWDSYMAQYAAVAHALKEVSQDSGRTASTPEIGTDVPSEIELAPQRRSALS